MVSHLCEETKDTFIADLVVGLCTGQIETAAPADPKSLTMYNRILRIEKELGSKASLPASPSGIPWSSEVWRYLGAPTA